MDRSFLEFLPVVLRKRARFLALVSAPALLLVFIFVRSMQSTTAAEVKVFVRLPTQSPIQALSNQLGFQGGLSALERDSFIASQEALVGALPLFEDVQRQFPEIFSSEASPPTEFDRVYFFIQSMLFGSDYVLARRQLYNPAFMMYRKSTYFRPNPSEGTFTVGFRHRDPKLAVAITRAIAQGLIDLNARIERDRAQKLSGFLGEKVTQTKQSLEETGRLITDFIAKNNFSDNSSILEERYRRHIKSQEAVAEAALALIRQQAILAEDIKFLENLERTVQKSGRSAREAKVLALTDQIRHLEMVITRRGQGNDAELDTSLQQRLEALKSRLSEQQRTGPEIISSEQLQKLIAETRLEVNKQKSLVEAAKKDLDRREKISKTYFDEVSKFPALQAELSKLNFSQAQLTKVLQTLNEQYLFSEIQSDVKVSQLFVLEEPMIANDLVSSSKMRILLSACCVLLMLIALGTGAFDYLRGTILFEQQLARTRTSHFLGQFPKIKLQPNLPLLEQLVSDFTIPRVAYRLERALTASASAKIVAICGDQSGIGKSVCLLGIAASLKKRGLSVLLIDADFRAEHRNVDALLRHDFEYKQAFHRNLTGIQNTGNPSALAVASVRASLTSDAEAIQYLKQVFPGELERVKMLFDFILIDTAPTSFPEVLPIMELANAIVIACPELLSTESRFATLEHLVNHFKRPEAQLFSVLTLAKSTEKHTQANYQKYQLDKRKIAA